jgi:hypothetical protein
LDHHVPDSKLLSCFIAVFAVHYVEEFILKGIGITNSFRDR